MLELVVNLSEEQLAEEKRLDKYAPFDCSGCGKRSYTTIRFIENHSEYCQGDANESFAQKNTSRGNRGVSKRKRGQEDLAPKIPPSL